MTHTIVRPLCLTDYHRYSIKMTLFAPQEFVEALLCLPQLERLSLSSCVSLVSLPEGAPYVQHLRPIER